MHFCSYIKWVEAGGARAVPVIIGRNKDYYEQVCVCVNLKSWQTNLSCLLAWTGCCCREEAPHLLEPVVLQKLDSSSLKWRKRLEMYFLNVPDSVNRCWGPVPNMGNVQRVWTPHCPLISRHLPPCQLQLWGPGKQPSKINWFSSSSFRLLRSTCSPLRPSRKCLVSPPQTCWENCRLKGSPSTFTISASRLKTSPGTIPLG